MRTTLTEVWYKRAHVTCSRSGGPCTALQGWASCHSWSSYLKQAHLWIAWIPMAGLQSR